MPNFGKLLFFPAVQSAGHKPNELVNGVRVSEMQRYVNQLHLARKRCERRIEALGGQTYWVGFVDDVHELAV